MEDGTYAQIESIRTIAANEGSQAEERTWKEQALLLRDKRITNKLGLLYTILERTDAQIGEVKEYIRDHGDGINEDGYDVRGVLTQANIKRRKLCTQISELEDEVAFDVDQQQVV